MEWLEEIEYYIGTHWKDQLPGPAVPDELHRALEESLGLNFTVDLVHPVVDEDVSFVMLQADGLILVRFDPPASTTVSFLGPLAGGAYTETVEMTAEGERRTGEFTHERLGDRSLTIRIDQPPPGRTVLRIGAEAAAARTDRLRKAFRVWAMEP